MINRITKLFTFFYIFTILTCFSESPSAITKSPTQLRCYCFKPNRIRNIFTGFFINAEDPKGYLYANHLINLEIRKKIIRKPTYYFEHYNNLKAYNESCLNGLSCKIKDCLRYSDSCSSDIEIAREFFSELIDKNYHFNEIIKKDYRRLYLCCYSSGHHNPLTLYDHGFLAYTSGNVEEAMQCTEKYINIRKNQNNYNQIQPQELLLLGQSYLELFDYDNAIETLSELIQKDPQNKEAYLNRSFAYFEKGNFDEAITDFKLSDYEINLSLSQKQAPEDFVLALMGSLCKGSSEAIVDFIPSLCSSTYGLGSALWVGIQTPLESSENFANACYEMCEYTINYCKTIDEEKIDDYVEQMKIIFDNYANLNDKELGETIGYAFGKYGVEIFGGSTALKALNSYRNLKNANRICNLEAMSLSAAHKEAIISSSLTHADKRKLYLKTVKYNFDAHHKHIFGHNDFIKTGSIWQHQDPESLLKQFAGTGHPERGFFGKPGYKETLDFKEHIGIWTNKEGTISLPTTRGTIHYGAKGAHIVPSNPNPKGSL